jgi:hypothetical protein
VKPDGDKTSLPGGINRPYDIRRPPRCRDRDKQIARTAKSQDLPLEQPLITVNIAYRGED